ncbi:MAG: di-trans,poly-cis-decaprenylcistransferase [Gammaproteobacteria bacterium]|nr:di-trans,poly-cis-decaprenylcistransferase [Gammaproteobacteria bacterium]
MRSREPIFDDIDALPADRLPKHVAIVMDGNGRWAKKRHLPRVMGHRAGVESARKVVKAARQRGIKVLSLFAFSTENWQRPLEEVNYLMKLLLTALQREIQLLHDHQVQLRVIGDRKRLSAEIQKQAEKVEAETAAYEELVLVIALNYGGQWDITQAACQLAQAIAAGQIESDTATPEQLSRYICLHDLPPLDLFIRTSGECRISNFFLWQLAYTELYFTDQLWPDFDETAFNQALLDFANRKRRFGQTE